jgi:hypothetical protein
MPRVLSPFFEPAIVCGIKQACVLPVVSYVFGIIASSMLLRTAAFARPASMARMRVALTFTGTQSSQSIKKDAEDNSSNRKILNWMKELPAVVGAIFTVPSVVIKVVGTGRHALGQSLRRLDIR